MACMLLVIQRDGGIQAWASPTCDREGKHVQMSQRLKFTDNPDFQVHLSLLRLLVNMHHRAYVLSKIIAGILSRPLRATRHTFA